MKKDKNIIGVIGLGYVGLPLALEFSKKTKVVGFDLNKERILELIKGIDRNNEVLNNEIKNLKNLKLSYEDTGLKNCNIFIITVPTPVDNKNLPDLTFLKSACEIVGKYISKNSIFILESTVYPGCTEKFCVPIFRKWKMCSVFQAGVGTLILFVLLTLRHRWATRRSPFLLQARRRATCFSAPLLRAVSEH